MGTTLTLGTSIAMRNRPLGLQTSTSPTRRRLDIRIRRIETTIRLVAWVFRLVLFEPFLSEVGYAHTGTADGRRALAAFGSRFNFARTDGAFLCGRAGFHRGGPAGDYEAEHLLVVAVLVTALAVSTKRIGTGRAVVICLVIHDSCAQY